MKESIVMNVQEVAEALQVPEPKAYQIIRKINRELEEKGYITVRGKVNREYFYKRVCCNE